MPIKPRAGMRPGDVLANIDSQLGESRDQALLIGGLAVNQYNPGRESRDIDLVAPESICRKIIRQCQSDEWDIVDENEDDLRPSWTIKAKSLDTPSTVLFGPKFTEESRYAYISWGDLYDASRAYMHSGRTFERIRVPQIEDLAYTKLISYLCRASRSSHKGLQDLHDFADLSNSSEFRYVNLLMRIRASGAEDFIRTELPRLVSVSDTQVQSLLLDMTGLFAGAVFPVRSTIAPVEFRSTTRPVGEIIQYTIGEIENRSRDIKDFSGALIPGLLQSPKYAVQVMATAGIREPIAAARARVERQDIVRQRDKTFRFLFHELATDPLTGGDLVLDENGAPICPKDAVSESLEGIASIVSENQADLAIGMVPTTALGARHFAEMYTIFDDNQVVIETMTASMTLTDIADTAYYQKHFDENLKLALEGRELVQALRGKLEQLS